MKSLINSHTMCAVVGVAALALTVPNSQAQNLLADPDFASGTAVAGGIGGWTPFNGAAFSANYEFGPTSYSMEDSGGGGYSVPGCYQYVAATPGTSYLLTGYAFVPTALTGASEGFLQVTFVDSTMTENLGTAQTSPGNALASTPVMNSTSTTGTWISTSEVATAPANTAYIEVFTLVLDATPTIVYFDELSLTVDTTATNLTIAPPNPVAIDGTNESFNVVSASTNGLKYQWQENGVNLTNNAGVSGATTSSLTLSNVQGSAEGTYTAVVYDNAGTNHASTYLTVLNPAHLTLDPNAPWLGYENYYVDSGGEEDGFLYGTAEPPAHLPATYEGAILTMTPNTTDYNSTNVEIVEADFYVQDDALAGLPLTFVGNCPSNSLVAPYTSVAFIEDFSTGYTLNGSIYSNLVAGQPFSISLTTLAGDHIQYGFQTVGPSANPTGVAALGLAQASINPPSMTASVAGSVVSLSFPTESGLQYSVLYKTNLLSSTWQTLSTVNGTAATVTVTNSTGPGQRFYRLAIQ
jgi:hypothetical protein